MNTLETFFSKVEQEYGACSKDIIWRLVYYKPNDYSDEAISVGVVINHKEVLSIDHICSTDALDVFTSFYGADARDQLVFALDLLKERIIERQFNFHSDHPPTNLLAFGRATPAECDDISTFSRDLLRLSSSLFRRYELVNRRFQPISQRKVIGSLRKQILQFSPNRGPELIRSTNVPVTAESTYPVPFYGIHTIGAPVSLVTTRVGEALKGAEAQMLKLSHARKVLNREPFVYVYTPPVSQDRDSYSSRVIAGLDELRVLGETSCVGVCSSDNIPELATELLHNEKLEPELQLPLQ